MAVGGSGKEQKYWQGFYTVFIEPIAGIKVRWIKWEAVLHQNLLVSHKTFMSRKGVGGAGKKPNFGVSVLN